MKYLKRYESFMNQAFNDVNINIDKSLSIVEKQVLNDFSVSFWDLSLNSSVFTTEEKAFIKENLMSNKVDLVNEGWLKLNDMNVFVDWLGHTYSKSIEPLNRNWRNYKYWSKYTDKQIESLNYLVEYLCNEFDIEKKSIGHNVYDENVDLFRGITFRSNYYKDITDVSPAFEFEKLLQNG
jgi:hypothetical protein